MCTAHSPRVNGAKQYFLFRELRILTKKPPKEYSLRGL